MSQRQSGVSGAAGSPAQLAPADDSSDVSRLLTAGSETNYPELDCDDDDGAGCGVGRNRQGDIAITLLLIGFALYLGFGFRRRRESATTSN